MMNKQNIKISINLILIEHIYHIPAVVHLAGSKALSCPHTSNTQILLTSSSILSTLLLFASTSLILLSTSLMSDRDVMEGGSGRYCFILVRNSLK